MIERTGSESLSVVVVVGPVAGQDAAFVAVVGTIVAFVAVAGFVVDPEAGGLASIVRCL